VSRLEYRTRNIEYPISKEGERGKGKEGGKMFNAQYSIFNVQVRWRGLFGVLVSNSFSFQILNLESYILNSSSMDTVICHISKKELPLSEAYKGHDIREPILQLIKNDYPEFDSDSYISIDQLNQYRQRYLTNLIEEERGDVSKLEREVIEAIANNKVLSENIEDDIEDKLTVGQKVADRIATFGGSWTFIIIFFSFLFLWMGINTWLLMSKAFDRYPYILLNLILSCLAAIQAPIIMMSQNRQEQKDRLRSEHDYKINLKAEIEIKLLNEKIDHLIIHQNKRLLEIQQIQTDYLEDILKEVKNNGK
jgi:uncharacterized membrane protein